MLENVRANLPMRLGSKKNVAEMLLTDNQEGLTQRMFFSFGATRYVANVSPVDIKTILGGLMSGGFETVFSTAIVTIGILSTPGGQRIQQKAYEDILSIYETLEEAFQQCLTEEKSSYIEAIVKEALRYYPPLKLLPARQTYKEFVYHGAVIPKGVLLYVNAQAANRGNSFLPRLFSLILTKLDKSAYGPDADHFRPERWLQEDRTVPPPYHYAFGAGARMCTAVNFSNRLLYAVFLRLIVAFKIELSKTMPPNTHYVHYKKDAAAANAVASDFKVKLIPRDKQALERCFARSEELSAGVATGPCSEPLRR